MLLIGEDKVCPVCGSIIDYGTNFCMSCYYETELTIDELDYLLNLLGG